MMGSLVKVDGQGANFDEAQLPDPGGTKPVPSVVDCFVERLPVATVKPRPASAGEGGRTVVRHTLAVAGVAVVTDARTLIDRAAAFRAGLIVRLSTHEQHILHRIADILL